MSTEINITPRRSGKTTRIVEAFVKYNTSGEGKRGLLIVPSMDLVQAISRRFPAIRHLIMTDRLYLNSPVSKDKSISKIFMDEYLIYRQKVDIWKAIHSLRREGTKVDVEIWTTSNKLYDIDKLKAGKEIKESMIFDALDQMGITWEKNIEADTYIYNFLSDPDAVIKQHSNATSMSHEMALMELLGLYTA